MNTEMGLYAIVRPKKPEYLHGKPHKVFENKLAQNFTAERANQKWCTDFTYLFLKNGEVRYNCGILDLYDRSTIASITDRHITSELAIRTLQKALDSQPMRKGELLLHSDQGAQYTSKAFVEYCESVHVTQSMSKAGCPYDNAPVDDRFPAGIPGCSQPARGAEAGNDRVSEKAALRSVQRKTQKSGRVAGGRPAYAL